MVILLFSESLFKAAPIESHLLEFAFASTITNRAIEWVICEEKLRHSALRFFNLFTLRGNDHAIRASDCAGGLQLRHLLDAHKTHPARRLQSEVGVIAEGGNIKPVFAAHVDQAGALGYLERFVVDGDVYKLADIS